MSGIAAGMESDFSGSDCDMVFTNSDTSRHFSKSGKCSEPEFVAIPASQAKFCQNFESSSVGRNVSKNSSRSQNRNNLYRHNQERQSKWREKRQVVQDSQPLDDLRYAVMQGNLDVVKSILSKGIYVDVLLKSGWTALMYASSAAHPDLVLYLLENKADPNFHKDMFTSLMAVCASSSGDEESLLNCLTHLLRFGAQVNVHERHLTTPLMFAARGGHFKLVMALLKAGATLNDRDNCSFTALSWAASEGHGIIVRHLLGEGASPTIVNSSGETAADLALHNGHKEVAAVLDRWCKQNGSVPDNEKEIELKVLSKSQKELLKGFTSDSVQKVHEKYYVTQGELELFLNGLGLSNFISIFKDHCLELADLLVMNDEELEKIGITQMGARKKILDASKATHKKEWEKASLPNLAQQNYISCPDAVAMMANIAKHLRFISASVSYIRTQIQTEPRILELAQETASVHDLLDETDDTLKNAKTLDNELKCLRLHLAKIQANAEYQPGDLITEPVPNKRSTLRKTMFFSFIAVSCTIILWKKPISMEDVSSFVKSHVNFCFGCETWEPRCTEVLS